jgi:exonuclease SbcC
MEVEKSKLYQEVRNLFIRTEDSLKNIIDTCTFDLELKKSSLVAFSENFENNNKNFSKEIEKKNEEVFNLQEGLKEKKEEVQEKVKNRSEPLKEEKEKTENSLESVLKEIEEITKLLNEKIASKDLLSDKLKLIENELNGVDDEFFDDFQEIQAAEDLIRVETSELEALLITSSNEKQKNQKEIEDCSQIIEKITEKLIKTVEVHQSFEERFKSIQNQIKIREASLSEVLKNKESLKSSKEKLSNCEKTLKTLTQEINSYQDELKQQESRIDEIKLKLPIMESEKKQARSNKLFKEAAKINNEIKEMTNELQSLLESSESLNISLLEKKSEDESLRESLLKHREELESLNEKIEKLSNFTSLDN